MARSSRTTVPSLLMPQFPSLARVSNDWGEPCSPFSPSGESSWLRVKRINRLHDSLATTHTAMSPLWSLVLQPTPVAFINDWTQQRRLLSGDVKFDLGVAGGYAHWMMHQYFGIPDALKASTTYSSASNTKTARRSNTGVPQDAACWVQVWRYRVQAAAFNT